MCTEKVLIRKVKRRIVQQNVSVSYCTAKNCTEAEVVLWRPGHYKLRRENFDLSGRHNEGCDGGTYKETCRGEIDFRIQGLPHSAVQEHDHIRKEAVQKWIHQFETHALQADLKQNRRTALRAEQGASILTFEDSESRAVVRLETRTMAMH